MVAFLSGVKDSSVPRAAKSGVCYLHFLLVHQKHEPSFLFPNRRLGISSACIHSFSKCILGTNSPEMVCMGGTTEGLILKKGLVALPGTVTLVVSVGFYPLVPNAMFSPGLQGHQKSTKGTL